MPLSLNRTAARKRIPKLLLVVCLVAFGLGLIAPSRRPSENADSESWAWVGFSFLFFMGGIIAISLFERIVLGLVNRLRYVGRLSASRLKMQRIGLFRYAGWFFVFVGAGLILSEVWMQGSRVWGGLEVLAGGVGLLMGLKIRRTLLTQNYE